MPEIRCFFVVESTRITQELRRYSSDSKCAASGYGYHNRSTRIEDLPSTPKTYISGPPVEMYKDDPRWPKHCLCGYEFRPEDNWQVFVETIYRREDTGEEWPLRALPPGAMYDAWWYRDGKGRDHKAGPDGMNLHVCLPPEGGLDYWHVDGPSKDGGHWTRSGTVPNITVSPSILTPRYHGHLRGGVLVPC